MIRRTFDPQEVNALINRPDIRPTVGTGTHELDCTDLLADRRNLCLMGEGGGAFFVWRGPGVFEGHSFFTARGRAAIRLGRELLNATGADLVWGLTPERLRHVRWFNRQIGMKSGGMIETPEGVCELFEMRFTDGH